MVNRYPGKCRRCGGHVAAKAGTLHRAGRVWQVEHLACAERPSVVSLSGYGRWEVTQNVKGRCIDAPCCGCCT